MSQAGIIDVESANPQIPTMFVTDSGTAIPLANVLDIFGTTVAAHGIPLRTTGAANVVTVQAQFASANATTDATKAGFSSFNSAQFTVDANGFVTLSGGGGGAVDAIGVDAATAPGTNPVLPTAGGLITVTGSQVAAGTTANVIRTDSLSANHYTIEIQRSQAVAATTIGDNGVSHFNSAEFTVDANGFVSLVGNAAAIEKIGVQTGTSPIVPTGAGLVTINGAVVAAGTNPVRTDGTGANTMAVEVQISQALAATDITKIGLSNFNSSFFTVDANGFVSINGSGVGETITGNTGGALSPTAGNWNILGTSTAAGSTPVQTAGSVSTLTVQVQKSQAIAGTDATKVGLAAFNSADFSVDANGFVTATGALAVTYTENSGTATPAAGNLNVLGTNSALTGYSPWTTGTGSTVTLNMPGTVKWVVNATANLGTHTTIQAAVTAASSGDDIFITSGTYTENVTLKSGVNLVSYIGDGYTPTVTISGTLTATFAGTCSISGIRLQTNAASFLSVTGSAATIVRLNECYLNVSSGVAGITYSSSSATSQIIITNCQGDVPSSTGWLLTQTSAGVVNMYDTVFIDSGASAVANTVTTGTFNMRNCYFSGFFTITSPTGAAFRLCNWFATGAPNLTTVTAGTTFIDDCYIKNNTANVLSIGSGTIVNLTNSTIESQTAPAISGAGTINYAGLQYTGASSAITTTTQSILREGPSRKIGSSNSGAANTFGLYNDSNTASSSTAYLSSVAGGTAADPVYQAEVLSTTTWTWGIDNSDSDAWVLAQGTALGTNNVMHVLTTGEINYPLQSAFLVTVTNSILNVTGDGTAYTVVWDTEVFDQNADMSTTTYTAPVTARVQLSCCVFLQEIGVGHTGSNSQITTSNRSYRTTINPGVVQAGGFYTVTNSILADMDAADTATCVITISGSTKTVDVFGGTNPTSAFSGIILA